MPYTPKSSPVSGGDTGTIEQYNDLRDDALEVAHTILSGLDAAKPANPTVSDVYYATDTKRLYFCFTINIWEELIIGIEASDTLQVSADTQRGAAGQNVLIKRKDIQVNYGGILRIKFDLSKTVDGTGNAQIYMNDVAVGTLRTATNDWVTHSEDIRVSNGGKVQLWLKKTSDPGDVYCRNFRLYFDTTVINKTIVVLD